MSALKKKIQRELESYNLRAQAQRTRFEKLYSKLESCTDWVGCREVYFSVKKTEKDLEENEYTFTPEDNKAFWGLYNELKDKYKPKYDKAQAKAIQEFEDCIQTAGSITEIKVIKQYIFEERLIDSRAVSKPLYDMADSKIKQLAA